jgi:carbon-monoxide dehydrogenase medium subunit
MYPSSFDYVRASTVPEAVALLQARENAKLLAGGHSLLPLMKLRTATAGTLVDIGRIAELKGVSRPNGSAAIGPLTTHSMIAASADLPSALREAAGNIGDLQVRNRGTIGGNIAHADPASDHPTVLIALGATFYMTGPSGQRFVPAGKFFTGLFETSLGTQDVLTGIEVPIHEKGTGSAYAKMVHPGSGYALLGAAAVLTIKDGKCTAARVAVGGLTPRAIRAPSVEAALVGQAVDEARIAAAAKAIDSDLGSDLLGDFYTSADYRKAMAPVYVQRALRLAAERAGQ